VDLLEYTGTRDIAAYLSVPAAIRYQDERDWPQVRATCHERLARARQRLLGFDGVSATHPDSEDWYAQMGALTIPSADPELLMERFYERHRIEALVHEWNGQTLLRVCIQGYNTESDVDALVDAFEDWRSAS
jgi:isopenicillin-N epimerase